MLSDDQVAYLVGHRVARLATVDKSGQPHAVPVCFAVVNGLIYTPLDRKPKRVAGERLRRVRDLAANPAVCLVVDTYDEDWTRLRWLQVRGAGSLVWINNEQRRAVEALEARYPQYSSMRLEELPVIRITPTDVVEWSWSDRTVYADGREPLHDDQGP